MSYRQILLVAVLGLLVVVPGADARTVLNVVPHGQSQPGSPFLETPGALPRDAQARMYDRLTPLFRNVTEAQLVPSANGEGFFKSAELKPEDSPDFISSETISGTGPAGEPLTARLKRDAYGVPYIFADSDAAATFAAGYVVAADRSLLLNQARYNGVAALVDLPGAPAIRLVLGLFNYQPTPTVLKEATDAQTAAIRAQGPRGRQLLNDIDVYLAGINTWYAANAPSVAKFTRTDIYALNAVKAQFLGQGGGAELGNAELLDGLKSKLGPAAGAASFDDLRGRDDPETYTTTNKRFPYQRGVPVARARGDVAIKRGSFDPAVPALPGESAGASASRFTEKSATSASNILIASGKRSTTGDPLFVGGPQIGYNYPGLTLEMQISSPSIKVRGATSAPFPGYMLIGTGQDFAWTLTSAGVDIIDTYAERLCGGSKTKYLFKGKCRTMETVDAGNISKGGQTVNFRFNRTVHGPVIGYARERGTNRLVALSQKRSSFGQDTVDQLFFQQLTYGRVKSARDFVNAAKLTPQTFNSFYASARESAFYTSGRLPLRPKGVGGDLPTEGSGKFEWRGFLAKNKQPSVVNPASGYIVNWNGKPAKGFPASDDRFGSEASLQRVQLLTQELARRSRQTLASVLAAANAGATKDVRGALLWPTMRRMLAKTKAPSTRAQEAADRLAAWYDAGATRVDADRDGKIDLPGAAIMDAAWQQMTNVAMCQRLGKEVCRLLESRHSRFDAPPGGQYAGWHQYMWKDFRGLLGDKVRGGYKIRYCGKGSVKRCSAGLWKALDAAAGRLAKAQGPDPSAWRASAADESIEFSPVPLLRIQYTNRPSGIHQVITFGD